MKLRTNRMNPPFYFMILFIAALGAYLVIDLQTLIYPPYSYGGVVLVLLGSTITIWSDYLFKKSGTTVKPYEKPCSLSVSGPFRFSRNPMYLGFTLILLGEGIFIGKLWFFVFPLIFMIICQVLYIPVEEKYLEDVFGNDYTDYKRRVRRWL